MGKNLPTEVLGGQVNMALLIVLVYWGKKSRFARVCMYFSGGKQG
jgi:hypothetical protein